MIATLLIILSLLVSAVVIDGLLAWRDRREQRRQRRLELENSEYDFRHDVKHQEMED